MNKRKPKPVGDIAVGETVWLNSGGPRGTVTGIDDLGIQLRVTFLTEGGSTVVEALAHCFTRQSPDIPKPTRAEVILGLLDLDDLRVGEIVTRSNLGYKSVSSVLTKLVQTNEIINKGGVYSRVRHEEKERTEGFVTGDAQ